MKFSIITASYNSMPFIEGCLDSLREQTGVVHEHLVIDGGSKDGTKEFLASKSGIRFISEADRGVYDALNKGASIASNEIIGILHTDDFFADKYVLSDVLKHFEAGAEVVFADLDYVSRLNPNKIIRKWKSKDFNLRELEFGWMPPHPTFFIKKNIYDALGGYDLNYRIAADYDFMLRVLTIPTLKVSYLPRTIVKMRVGGVSNKSLKNLKLKMKEDFLIAAKHFSSPLGTLLLKNFRKVTQFI